MRTGRFLNLVLLTLLFGASLLAWPTLPAELPSHLNIDGRVTRWTDATPLAWFGMPLLALGLNLLLYVIMRFATRDPRGINLPNKDRLLALPEHRQQVVLEEVKGLLELPCIEVTVIFCLVQYALYRAAVGGDTKALMIVIIAVPLLTAPVLVITMILRIQAAIDRQVELERASATLSRKW